MKIRAMLCCFLLSAVAMSAARAQDASAPLYTKAQAAADAKNYDLAIKYWSEALKLEPDDPALWFNRATAYQSKNDLEHALSDITEAINLNPTDVAYKFRGQLYEKLFDAARIDIRFRRRYAESAIADYSMLIGLKPEYENYDLRATLYCQMGEYRKAIPDYTAMIRLNPGGMAGGIQARGDAYWKAGEADKAFTDYNQVIRLEPNFTGGYRHRGLAYLELGQLDSAVADFTRTIQLSQQFGCYQFRGQAYVRMGELDKAIADFNEVIRRNQNPSYDPMLLGEVYFLKGDWDKAIAGADESIKLDPKWTHPYALRGSAYASKGMYDKAFEDFNHLMAASPDFAWGYSAAARLYATCPKQEIRNGSKAVGLAQKACDLSQWKDAGFIDTLAAAEAEAGRWDDALKHEKQAVALARSMKEDEPVIEDYSSRIALYEGKKPFHTEKQPKPIWEW